MKAAAKSPEKDLYMAGFRQDNTAGSLPPTSDEGLDQTAEKLNESLHDWEARYQRREETFPNKSRELSRRLA